LPGRSIAGDAGARRIPRVSCSMSSPETAVQFRETCASRAGTASVRRRRRRRARGSAG
jgi:hypothetical protein